MTVLECARQLGAAIQEDETYIQYQMARQANDEDQALQDKIGEFNLLRMSLVNEQGKDDADKGKIEQLNEQIQQVYADIMQNPNMVAYNAAKDEMDRLLARVNSILGLCVNGEDTRYLRAERLHRQLRFLRRLPLRAGPARRRYCRDLTRRGCLRWRSCPR